MDPRLVTSKDLRVRTPRRDRGAAPAALAVLLVAVALTGVAQARLGTDTDVAAPVGPAIASPLAGVIQIAGTDVPAPPADGNMALLRTSRGLHVFAPGSPLARPEVLSLFGFYLDAMPAQGWILVGKGDPRGAGDWVQRWQAGDAAALLTFTTAPRNRLEVELCPPDPYC